MRRVPTTREGWQRRAGTLLVAVGVVLALVAATSAARAMLARDTARARWAEMEAQRAAAGGRLVAKPAERGVIARGTPVARLLVPRLDLDEVIVEGVGDAELYAGPGHMIGSALPGERGNSVLSAHRDRHFRTLGRIAVGDTIHTESNAGAIVWKVMRVRVVSADAAVLRSSRTPVLTLTTCWPIRFFGSAPDRLVVEAFPVG